MAYATVAQLREYLRTLPSLTSSPNAAGVIVTAQDSVLQAVLDRATDVIDKVLTFSFAAYPDTATARTLRVARGVLLELPAHQAGSITGYVDCVGAGGSGIAIPTTDILLTSNRAGTKWAARYHAGWRGPLATVTAKWGYGQAPASIVEVCLELAVNIWRSATRGLFADAIGVDQVGNAIGGGSLAYSQQLTRTMKATLEAVRAQYVGVAV